MSLLDLNTELTRYRSAAKRRQRKARKNRNGHGATAPASTAASRRRVRQFDAVSYRAPGIVPPIRQVSSMTCWATVTAMMVSWKRDQSQEVRTIIGDIGAEWLAKYDANAGLLASDKPRFLTAVGLQAEPPLCYSIEGWLQMLRSYGPLWVTTDEDPSAGFAIHARIMVGISGDGTEAGTQVQIVDPASGTEYTEPLTNFVRKFEEEARDQPANWVPRVQVVHWPPNARSSSQSFSRARSLRNSRAQSYGRPNRGSRSFEAVTLAWGARVSEEFRNRVREICGNLGCDANHLMAAMAFETGETFSPSIRNPSSGATGLIQFMPSTARNLGTTTDALAAMSAVEQLGCVERYFQPFNGRLRTLEDVYMAILWPRAVGKPNDYVLFSRPSRAYELNSGLDRDRNGDVTKNEASGMVQAKLTKGLRPENAS